MSPSNFSFFKKDPSKSYTPTSTVVVRPLQGPPPMVHKKIPPVQPAVVLPTKRRRVDGSGSLPMKKSRSNSADSTTPPPVRDRSAPHTSSSARASVSARASRNGTPSTSRAGSAIPRNAQGLSPAERNCMAKDVGRGLEDVLSSADVYRERLSGYIPYFTNPADPEDLTFSIVDGRCLTVSLELPARGATEEYILVTPRDPDHYDPLRDLEETLYTIVEHYLTPAQAMLFGPIPTKLPTDSDTLQPSSDGTPPLLRLFKRTLTRRDGPAFISALASINRTLRSLKYPSPPSPSDTPLHNALSTNISRWTNTGMPFPVVSRILEESYQRIVRPQTHTLLEYEAFASTVYGELLPTFISRLLRTHAPHLRPGSLFLDLGSGVGQVCVQAALETGCDAYGIEIQHGAANVATQMADHVRKRAARGWGVKMGRVALEEGDMIASETVSKKIAQADVILVNNKVFTADLNDALRQKFLDCREGALVISLQPFSASDRAIDDPAAIFVHTQHEFYSGDVSWAATGGTYYVHVVDREGHRERVERMQSRPTRSRR